MRPSAKFAGVLPPTTIPKFEVSSSPVWTPHTRVSGVANPEASPSFATDAAQNTVYQYQSDGNSYLTQTWDSEMAFEQHATTPGSADVFAFKCLIKPFEIHGRRLLYSTKNKLRSGGIFVDQVDGKVRVGWYDTVQKREVYISTNVPVLDPYHWHYLYVRKRYPDTTLGSGCWADSIYNLTPTETHDVMVVRRFRKESMSVWKQRTWDYKPHALVGTAFDGDEYLERQFVGFTTDLQYSVSGASATGLVSRSDRTFTYTAGGVVTASATVFSPDMVGMLFSVGDRVSTALPDAFSGLTYRISAYTSATQVTIVDPIDGGSPASGAMANSHNAGVYSGVRLVKSEGFSTSEAVDQTSYDIEVFGSHLAKDAESGVLPFVGQFASFGYVVAQAANPDLFETAASTGDNACTGTDHFGNVEIYAASATALGPLHSNETARYAFTAVDTGQYSGPTIVSSLPNEKLEVAVVAAESSLRARPLVWKFLRKPSDLSKKRKVRVAFYDPDQAQVSNPGPELSIQPGGDDASNPSGAISVKLTGLPVSRDAGDIETWVYMTQPDGDIYYLVATVPSGTSAVVVSKSDAEIGRGVELEFDNWAPPECDVIEVVSDSLACGNLRRLVNDDSGEPQDLPDVVIFSKSFVPVAFPGANLISVADGSRSGVTGLREFNGRLLIAKRDSLYRAAVSQNGTSTETVSSRIGAASGAALVLFDSEIVFWGKQGLYGYSGGGVPVPISDKLQGLFRDGGVDPGSALVAVGAIHAKRSQVVVVMRENGASYTSHRVSIEPGFERGVRFSRYEGPNLTAVADFAGEYAEVGELVGGTEEGFFVWLDRSDTATLMLGDSATHGDSALVVGAASTTTKVVTLTGDIDGDLAGPRGAVLRWGSTQAVVLFADGLDLHLDRPVASAPALSTAATLGRPVRYWRTKWLDLEIPEATKKTRYLDVIFTVGSGTVTCSARLDFGTTDYALASAPSAPASASQIALATSTSGQDVGPGFRTFEINHLMARFYQFTFESPDPFEIVELVVRLSDADAQ